MGLFAILSFSSFAGPLCKFSHNNTLSFAGGFANPWQSPRNFYQRFPLLVFLATNSFPRKWLSPSKLGESVCACVRVSCLGVCGVVWGGVAIPCTKHSKMIIFCQHFSFLVSVILSIPMFPPYKLVRSVYVCVCVRTPTFSSFSKRQCITTLLSNIIERRGRDNQRRRRFVFETLILCHKMLHGTASSIN